MSSPSTQAVLLVGQSQLRILVQSARDTEPRWSTLELEDESPRFLATAAKAELARLGFKGRKIILALDSDLIEQKRVAVPELPRRERDGVWNRRAASLLKCDAAETVYMSVPLARSEERTEDAGNPWLLFALHRTWLQGVQFELRRVGISVSRVALLRLALLEWSCERLEDDGAPFLLVAREQSATTLSLLCEDELIQQSVLPTRREEDKQGAAVALVQELRVLSSHWRKLSRGKELGRIALLGFTDEYLDPLVAAIHAALGGVEITSLTERTDESEEAQALELLIACTAEGRLQTDLQIALPPRPGPAVGISLALAGAVAAVGVPFMNDSQERLTDAREQVIQLGLASADLDSLRRVEDRHAEATESIQSEIQHWVKLQTETVPVESIIPRLFAAFQGRAELASIQARSEEDATVFKVSGLTRGTTQEVYAILEQLRLELAALPGAESVQLIPPARVPDSENLSFIVEIALSKS